MNNVEEFMGKVNADASLTERYNAISGLGELSRFASSLGYNVTPEQFQDYYKNNSAGLGLNDLSGGTSMMGTTKTWYSGD